MGSIQKLFIFILLVVSLLFPVYGEEFVFIGKAQTKYGDKVIETSEAIKVNEDLIQGKMVVPDMEEQEERDANSLYQSLFDIDGQFNYDTCNAWCSLYWYLPPYECVKVIQSYNDNGTPNEYLCCHNIVFTKSFIFRGMVETEDGKIMYITECDAIRVKEDLGKYHEDDVMKVTADAIYKSFFNDEGGLDFSKCNSSCSIYCTTRPGTPLDNFNSDHQCVMVKESSNVNGSLINQNEYLCGCEIESSDPPMEASLEQPST